MRIGLSAICLAAAIVAASPSPAQQVNIADHVRVGPEMKRLEPMLGPWNVKTEFYRSKLGQWQAGPEFTAHYEPRYGGHYIDTEQVPPGMGFPYVAQISFSYDKFRKVYRAFFRDGTIGLLDIFEGNFEGETLYIDNRKSGTAGPSASGKLEPNRMGITIVADDKFILTVQAWRGEKWVEGLRFTYSRNPGP